MALNATIGRKGGSAEKTDVTATVTADKGDAGIKILSSKLTVVAHGLSGIPKDQFADVARAYVDLRGLQMRSAVLHSGIDVLQQSMQIVNERYERGITNELDVTLAARELNSLKAQVAPLDAQVDAAQYAIATLLGQYPEELVQELTPKGALPLVPPAVAAGLPVELLRRRPDIQVAERQLASQLKLSSQVKLEPVIGLA